jgi:hypothetical protein
LLLSRHIRMRRQHSHRRDCRPARHCCSQGTRRGSFHRISCHQSYQAPSSQSTWTAVVEVNPFHSYQLATQSAVASFSGPRTRWRANSLRPNSCDSHDPPAPNAAKRATE